MLLDSNIVIYATQPAYKNLRDFITEHAPAVSVITQIEVLGYHKLREEERVHLEHFFRVTEEVLPISGTVVQKAIELRQRRRMSLGDSIIAATALVHEYTLVTRNTDDFKWIKELSVLNPM